MEIERDFCVNPDNVKETKQEKEAHPQSTKKEAEEKQQNAFKECTEPACEKAKVKISSAKVGMNVQNGDSMAGPPPFKVGPADFAKPERNEARNSKTDGGNGEADQTESAKENRFILVDEQKPAEERVLKMEIERDFCVNPDNVKETKQEKEAHPQSTKKEAEEKQQNAFKECTEPACEKAKVKISSAKNDERWADEGRIISCLRHLVQQRHSGVTGHADNR
nr:hypothetical protein Iba_chr05dCG19610 [Ipomoea batatas]